ncbi:MAG: DUF4258 domain-containing protein [Candidatus Kapabacteria bacterium]|nr:DUF4258 domain-containing protein [Candidatus Kapabacteria bacterium]
MNEKPIRLSKHALIQCQERGVSTDEVIETIRNGTREPAKENRFQSKQNFQYNDFWFDSFYPIKQVAPVFVDEEDEIVVVTVYSYYF